MKVGDLVRVAMATSMPANPRIQYKGQLAVVIDNYVATPAACIPTLRTAQTMVKLISDGAELWFLTKELEAINESR